MKETSSVRPSWLCHISFSATKKSYSYKFHSRYSWKQISLSQSVFLQWNTFFYLKLVLRHRKGETSHTCTCICIACSLQWNPAGINGIDHVSTDGSQVGNLDGAPLLTVIVASWWAQSRTCATWGGLLFTCPYVHSVEYLLECASSCGTGLTDKVVHAIWLLIMGNWVFFIPRNMPEKTNIRSRVRLIRVRIFLPFV